MDIPGHASPLPNYFDAPIAERYDDPDDEMFSDEVLSATTAFLAAHARGGAALELAIGTGRVALPLAARGVPVTGIEYSQAMVDQLTAKPGGDRIPVVVGDMSSAKAPGAFTLAYLVYNTLGNLTTQDSQVACFVNAASHLEPGGRFVVEQGMPILQKLPPGESIRTFAFERGVRHSFDTYDVATQTLTSNHFRFFPAGERGGEYRLNALPFRYVWPAETDLMARIAGMRLIERWADWDRSPFTSDSAKHVSVWEKAA